MIRHLQNEADIVRSSTWRRRRRIQEMAARLPSLRARPTVSTDEVRPGATAIDARTPRLPAKKSLARKSLPTGPTPITGNIPVTLRLVDRIPSGTDPLQDLAIVNIVTGTGGKPSGPKRVMLIVDLADRIADGSIRLDNGEVHHRRRTRGWEAPHYFELMRTYLVDRIRGTGIGGTNGSTTKPEELICFMAQALGVPNTVSDNDRYIDAVWAPGHDKALGRRPNRRAFMLLRKTLRLRDAENRSTRGRDAGGTAA